MIGEKGFLFTFERIEKCLLYLLYLNNYITK